MPSTPRLHAGRGECVRQQGRGAPPTTAPKAHKSPGWRPTLPAPRCLAQWKARVQGGVPPTSDFALSLIKRRT